MPSFKLFRIDESYDIFNMVKEDILKKIQVNKEDPLTEKKLVESLKKTHRNLSFSSEKKKNIIKMEFDEYIKLRDEQNIWIRLEKHIIKNNQVLLVGKTEKKIEMLFQLYLRKYADSRPIVFSDKHLWQVWLNIKSEAEKRLMESKLHRLIIKRTFINADKITELNINAPDVGDLGITSELIKQAEKIQAITVKIKGLYENSKWVTFKLDKSGSIMFYGKHSFDILLEILNLLNIK